MGRWCLDWIEGGRGRTNGTPCTCNMHAKEASFKTGSATAAAKTAAPLILFRSGEAGIGNVVRDAIQIFGNSNRRTKPAAAGPNPESDDVKRSVGVAASARFERLLRMTCGGTRRSVLTCMPDRAPVENGDLSLRKGGSSSTEIPI